MFIIIINYFYYELLVIITIFPTVRDIGTWNNWDN
jgi:hypothetical protein